MQVCAGASSLAEQQQQQQQCSVTCSERASLACVQWLVRRFLHGQSEQLFHLMSLPMLCSGLSDSTVNSCPASECLCRQHPLQQSYSHPAGSHSGQHTRRSGFGSQAVPVSVFLTGGNRTVFFQPAVTEDDRSCVRACPWPCQTQHNSCDLPGLGAMKRQQHCFERWTPSHSLVQTSNSCIQRCFYGTTSVQGVPYQALLPRGLSRVHGALL